MKPSEQPPTVYYWPLPDPAQTPVPGFSLADVARALELVQVAAQRPYTPTDPAPSCACGPDCPGCAAARAIDTES